MKAKFFLLFIFTIIFCTESNANHIFGGEFYYTFVSGNTYTFNLNLYGDCSTTTPASLNSLPNATPVIYRYKNGVFVDSFQLDFIVGSDVDITPTCVGQATSCTNTSSSINGVKQFKYNVTFNLGSTSANWRFLFTGNLGGNSIAGRSNSLTNINNTPLTTIALEATLNNNGYTNSSPIYTSLPTPFSCISKPVNYNQGAVDPDGDNLTFGLVPGINGTTGGNVPYVAPYTYLNPLAVNAGTFSFSTTSGQLNFTPSALQKSLVVTKVTEKRNGVVVGTSMREMPFVILNCNNDPPSSSATGIIGGGTDSVNSITACSGTNNLSFAIPMTDPDGNNLNVTYSGVPTGAVVALTGNNTSSPIINFSWQNTAGLPVGVYNFYVSYQDNACPLSSKNTIAFTIHIVPNISLSITTTPVNCSNATSGGLSISTTGGFPNYTYTLSSTVSQNYNVANTPLSTINFFNLPASTFTITVTDANSCTATTNAIVNSAPVPTFTSITKSNASCLPGCDASITVNASSANVTYAINNGTFASTNTFNNLCVGTYTIVVKDANACSSSTTVSITNPTSVTIATVTSTHASCSPGCDAQINNIIVSPSGTYTYTVNNSPAQSSNTFTNLCVGTYTIVVKDANGCVATSVTTLSTSPLPVVANTNGHYATCMPGCDGSIFSLQSTGYNPPYTYALNTGAYTTDTFFNNVCVGTYTISTKDAMGCVGTKPFSMTQPLQPSFGIINTTTASCTPACDGSIIHIGAGAITLPIVFAINNGTYQNTDTFINLCANTYTLSIKDGDGCTATSSVNISTQTAPSFTAPTLNAPSCTPGCDGGITVNANSNLSLQYANNVSALQASNNFANLCVGVYTLTVKDSKNCTATSTVDLQKAPNPNIKTALFTNELCNDDKNGTITQTTVGTGAIHYVLLPTNDTNSIGSFTALAPQSYTLTATDSKGCSISNTYTILNPLAVNIDNITTTDQHCEGKNDGTISVAASGGTGSLTYTLIPINAVVSNGNFANLAPSEYSVQVTDANGCKSFEPTKVNANVNPLEIILSKQDVPCTSANANGWAYVQASKGFLPYTYSWNTDPVQTTARATNLYAGWFTVTVADLYGCTKTDSVFLKDPTYCCEEINLPNAFTPNGDWVNDIFYIKIPSPVDIYQFEIYNRYGQKVWETKDLSQGWDGYYKGIACDMNTYYYIFRYKCLVNKKDYVKQGDILLVR